MDDVITELNELNDLIKNTCKHLSHNYNENSPYRNTLLRTLIDKLFEMLKNPKVILLKLNRLKEDVKIYFFFLFV